MANVTLNVTDAKGQATGTVEAPEALFGVSAEDVQAHIPAHHQAGNLLFIQVRNLIGSHGLSIPENGHPVAERLNLI